MRLPLAISNYFFTVDVLNIKHPLFLLSGYEIKKPASGKKSLH